MESFETTDRTVLLCLSAVSERLGKIHKKPPVCTTAQCSRPRDGERESEGRQWPGTQRKSLLICTKKKGRTLEEELLFFSFFISTPHSITKITMFSAIRPRLASAVAKPVLNAVRPRYRREKKALLLATKKKIAGIVIVITSPDSFFLIQEQSEKRTPTSKDQIQGRNQDKTTIQLSQLDSK